MPGQDMPPPGGFARIQYRRNLPQRGPSGLAIFSFFTATTIYGFYKVFQGRSEKYELEREKAWARIYLVPLLQAEMDRDVVKKEQRLRDREEKLLADGVPDWIPRRVYSTDRYVASVVRPGGLNP